MGHTATGYDHLVNLTREGLYADHILVSVSMKLQTPLDKSAGSCMQHGNDFWALPFTEHTHRKAWI